ncbi:MAG: hypothetical protein WCB27_21320 [Thermoguttaceae bacterium]
MDPVSSLVAGHVSGKLMDYIVSQFRSRVVERWSKRRAEQFFDEFCREVNVELSGGSSSKLDDLLSNILEDEVRSEVLFDAYRRVCLAKSRSIGPRIIGILTAELVLQNRTATDAEDAMLGTAENLTDDELLAYAAFFREQMARALDPKTEDVKLTERGDLRIEWYKEQFDSNWRHDERVSIAPLDLAECIGRWALKMKSHGIILDDMKERQWEYKEDGERHIDQDGSVREISWWLTVPKAYFRLAELVERASRGLAIET